MKKVYQLETLTCPSCAMKIEGALKKIKGVDQVQVLFNASKVKVDFQESIAEESKIKNTIEELGFDVLGEK